MFRVAKELKISPSLLSSKLLIESWIGGFILGSAFLAVAGWLVFWQTYQNKVLPAVYIENISVGGLTYDQAIAKIQSNLPELSGVVTLTYSNETSNFETESELSTEWESNNNTSTEWESNNNTIDIITLTLQDLDSYYEAEKAVRSALKVGREESFLEKSKTLLGLFLFPKVVPVEVSYSSEKLNSAVDEFKNRIFIASVDPKASLVSQDDQNTIELESGSYGRKLDFDRLSTLLWNQLQTFKLLQKTNHQIVINLNSVVVQTGRVLNKIEQEQAIDTAQKLVGMSVLIELPTEVQKIAVNQSKLPVSTSEELLTITDDQLISLLEFPSGVNINQVKSLLESWNEMIKVTMVEPKLTVETSDAGDLKVLEFLPPQDGVELNIDQAAIQLLEVINTIKNEQLSQDLTSLDSATSSLSSQDLSTQDLPTQEASDDQKKSLTYKLPVIITKPSTELSSLNDLGIKERIGLGLSQYQGSIPNRVFNVGLTASRINNLLIAPSEEFSFNQALGVISKNTGFKSAYVIKDGKTVLGDGGGVCQVSTTVFRAALDAGLEITKRLQHSYRVGYYEQGSLPGLDATVYSGNIDLRFKNDTEHYILMHNVVNSENLTLTTEFYGTSDGRSTEIISHEVWDSRPAPPPEFFSDSNLPTGKIVQVDWAVGGVKTRVKNEIKNELGQTVRIDEYYSNYIPWSAKYAIGE
jgi:vancomycin resistance protein YoaR